jgi:hypothetical protein
MALGTLAPNDHDPSKALLRGLFYPELSAPITALRGRDPAANDCPMQCRGPMRLR